MSRKVLIPDAVDPVCDEILRAAGCSVLRMEKPTTEEIIEVIGEYDAVIVRSAVKVTAEMIRAATAMKVIGRAGAGVDNIDLGAAAAASIEVRNTPGGNTISAAEHAVALLLALLKKIPAADHSVKSGEWNRKAFGGTELYEKCVGIVGLGKIGREVLIRLKAFGVSILGYDPHLNDEEICGLGAEPSTLQNLIANSDIITLHVPLTHETRGMLGAAEFQRMKDGVFIVNAARGGIVVEAALEEGLASGKVAGAALDVYEQEPVDPDSTLLKRTNVIATPHVAATTGEAQRRVAVQIARSVLEVLGAE